MHNSVKKQGEDVTADKTHHLAPCINSPTDNGEVEPVRRYKVHFSSNTKAAGRWLRPTGLLSHV